MDQRRKQNYARKRRHVSNISPDCHTNQTTINSTDSSKQINRPPNTRINERNGVNFPTAKTQQSINKCKVNLYVMGCMHSGRVLENL